MVESFGKYQILHRIASGGMAEIYKARLEGIGGFQRTFAIKRILPHLSRNPEYVSMLVDEAKVAGLLSHANIVQILDLGQVEGIWYIAMEFVNGRDFGDVLRRAKSKGLSLPVPHMVFVAIELLKGLEYAHQRQVMRGGRPVPLNIIHRDVSPPNIMLSFQGEVKLTDFGIARASLKALETQSGVIKGRFDYMSPEQAEGAKDLDQRSDLFSVGVVLYEGLTGVHPFRGENELATAHQVQSGKYKPLSAINTSVPFTLETIVDRALRVNREDRYPTATAFKEALDKFFHDAGFIFTHSTLASYVRGLYPTASNPRSARAAAEATREADVEPTGVMDIAPGVAEEPTTTSEFFGMRGDDEEEPTQIRKNPLLDYADADGPTVAMGDPASFADPPSTTALSAAGEDEWLGEQETVIKPNPLRGLDPVDSGDDPTLGVLASRGPPTLTDHGRPIGEAGRTRLMMVLVAVGGFFFLSGLMVGIAVGLATGFLWFTI